MTRRPLELLSLLIALALVVAVWEPIGGVQPEALAKASRAGDDDNFNQAIRRNARTLLRKGRRVFRFDTFGDQAFWGDALRLHDAIKGEDNGGTGPGLSPAGALALGLKVDSKLLPEELIDQIQSNDVDLQDPDVTIALLRLNAVVGVTGFFNDSDELTSVGIQCALCHSTVDDSVADGIGARLDGWANRDLDVGKIVALAPNLQPFADLLQTDQQTVRTVLENWGVGKFDAELSLDGKTEGPQGSAATLIPPAFGLAGVNLHTWTGWGSVTHWNAFVANLEMHGQGTFYDARLRDADKFPIAAREGFDAVVSDPDLVTKQLAALHVYQLDIPAPAAPAGSFDEEAAVRGAQVFREDAKCAMCHVPPLFTEPGWNMHTPEEIGIDDFQAKRSPDERYRTSPLKGLWTHTKGGFYHDGRFATLEDVVMHYDNHLKLGLSEQQVDDLVEYLKSL